MPARSSDPLKSLPPLPKMATMPRPRPLRSFTAHPQGPKLFHLFAKPVNIGGGPGDPPPGFIMGHNSKTEWLVYWALAKIFDDPKHPRQPPFAGGQQWGYQTSEDAGRVPGGQVLDFVVLSGLKKIGIRVDTEHFHIFTSAATQEKDFYLRTHLRSVDQVVSIYDQDFIGDPTGKAVIAVVAKAIKGDMMPNPIKFGTGQRIRP